MFVFRSFGIVPQMLKQMLLLQRENPLIVYLSSADHLDRVEVENQWVNLLLLIRDRKR